MRTGAVIENGKVVNVIVLADGEQGDEAIDKLGCIEITDMEPMPQINWDYDGNTFSYTPSQEELDQQERIAALIEARRSAVAKLAALGLTENEIMALIA